eukprot:TRINITY_DN110_c0_g1_i1.p1 TRINITY_DN110_c0_g1~~TRINITY_DN110_c0_g1_i1.p1  ORF type:complete len:1356 (+),score=541.37 TRINITY_DN110_c0_g1_i1:948-5015(+)
MCGTYEALDGGSVASGLVDLTGGSSEKIKWEGGADAEEMWARLVDAKTQGHLMGCAFTDPSGAIEADNGRGILANHAYGLLDVQEIAGARIVRIRNPWGEGEWRGAWSDGSREWNPDIQRDLDYEFSDDGTFWMSVEDFLANFNKLYICRLYQDQVGDTWRKNEFHGKWNTALSGGSVNNAETWLQNPQFSIKIPEQQEGEGKARVFVALSQEDIRPTGLTEFNTAIGMYVLKNGEEGGARRDELDDPEDVLYSAQYEYGRSVSTEFIIEEGQEYIIMPTTYEPGQKGKFLLTVYCNNAEVECEPYDVDNVFGEDNPLPEGPPDIDDIADKLRDRGVKFDDTAFPANDLSLYKNVRHPPAERTQIAAWKRPTQFIPKPSRPPPLDGEEEEEEEPEEEEDEDGEGSGAPALFKDDVAPGDVIQGGLGDCYFLGALSVMATKPDLLKGIFVGEDQELGYYQCRFHRFGEEVTITVDDQFPCIEEKLPIPEAEKEKRLEARATVKAVEDEKAALRAEKEAEKKERADRRAAKKAARDAKKAQRDSDADSDADSDEEDEESEEEEEEEEDEEEEEEEDEEMKMTRRVAMLDPEEIMYKYTPAYGHCRDPLELWVPVVEKAYAKLNTCYENLDGGSVSQALVDLTGGTASKIDLKTEKVKADAESGAFFDELVSYYEQGTLMGCAKTDTTVASEEEEGDGLLAHHAYGILRVAEAYGNQLIQLRNPWGQGEWEGDWCDASKLWTKKIMNKLEYRPSDDGTFWMCLDDFLDRFNKLYLCKVYSEEDEDADIYKRTQVKGRWDEKYCGGSVNNRTSWLLNPQYRLFVPKDDDEDDENEAEANSDADEGSDKEDGEPKAPVKKTVPVTVTLTQPDIRPTGKTEFEQALGIYLLTTTQPRDEEDDDPNAEPTSLLRKEKVKSAEEVAYQANFEYARSITVTLDLEPGQEYILMPCTYEPGYLGEYLLNVVSTKEYQFKFILGDKLPFRPLNDKRLRIEATGKWTTKKAGGCPNYGTWKNNPQFCVRSDDRDIEVTVEVEQEAEGDSEEALPIGFQMVRNRRAEKISKLSKNLILGHAPYVYDKVAFVDVTLKKGVNYILVPSTFEPGQKGKFTVRVLSHKPIHLERVDKYQLPATYGKKPVHSLYVRSSKPGKGEKKKAAPPTAGMQRAFVLVKPDAMSLGSVEAILSIIEDHDDLYIVEQQQFSLSAERVAEIFPHFDSADVDFISTGPVLAVSVLGPNAIADVNALIGPADPSEAQASDSTTLRAMYGTDSVRNAVYASQTEQQANLDTKYFFPNVVLDPIPSTQAAHEYLGISVNDTLVAALTELSKARPAEPLTWLGQWLLENNPNQARVAPPANAVPGH